MTEHEEDERLRNLRLAKTIEAYWAARGHKVEVRTVVAGAFNFTIRAVPYRIISDMKNGLPQTQADRSL